MQSPQPLYRKPRDRDGAAVHRLIARCRPLDENSRYCNLLQCTHFADTSAAAELDGELMGFVSGYRVPERPDTLFIWQVAVDDRARGKGLARGLLRDILSRPGARDLGHLETTITRDNEASWALFRSLARSLGAPLQTRTLFERDAHFAGQHEDEVLVRIGPFKSPQENQTR